ncbi:hypothetical protein PV325_007854 [Microctonus aethiopoides]|nr:hypothetical protein PV325_007854 [Microctonus aethiopoides]KAK0079002.1 hypothetical protein PV326_009022 [Microctonus aethiopoides]
MKPLTITMSQFSNDVKYYFKLAHVIDKTKINKRRRLKILIVMENNNELITNDLIAHFSMDASYTLATDRLAKNELSKREGRRESEWETELGRYFGALIGVEEGELLRTLPLAHQRIAACAHVKLFSVT